MSLGAVTGSGTGSSVRSKFACREAQRPGVSRLSSGLGPGSPFASPSRTPRGSSGDHASGRTQTWIVLELAHLGSLQVYAVPGCCDPSLHPRLSSLVQQPPSMGAVYTSAACMILRECPSCCSSTSTDPKLERQLNAQEQFFKV